jgi:hypothetical protein
MEGKSLPIRYLRVANVRSDKCPGGKCPRGANVLESLDVVRVKKSGIFLMRI